MNKKSGTTVTYLIGISMILGCAIVLAIVL